MKSFRVRVIKRGRVAHDEVITVEDYEIEAALEQMRVKQPETTAEQAARARAAHKAEPIVLEHDGDWADVKEVHNDDVQTTDN